MPGVRVTKPVGRIRTAKLKKIDHYDDFLQQICNIYYDI